MPNQGNNVCHVLATWTLSPVYVHVGQRFPLHLLLHCELRPTSVGHKRWCPAESRRSNIRNGRKCSRWLRNHDARWSPHNHARLHMRNYFSIMRTNEWQIGKECSSFHLRLLFSGKIINTVKHSIVLFFISSLEKFGSISFYFVYNVGVLSREFSQEIHMKYFAWFLFFLSIWFSLHFVVIFYSNTAPFVAQSTDGIIILLFT